MGGHIGDVARAATDSNEVWFGTVGSPNIYSCNKYNIYSQMGCCIIARKFGLQLQCAAINIKTDNRLYYKGANSRS